jgi:hypothetical protein
LFLGFDTNALKPRFDRLDTILDNEFWVLVFGQQSIHLDPASLSHDPQRIRARQAVGLSREL